MVSRHMWISKILKQGYQLIMITNQSGINRGLYVQNFIDLSFYIHNELWNNNLNRNKFLNTPKKNVNAENPRQNVGPIQYRK